ncbi:(d)CMP kinase [Geovibrio thiophilus]|uniref:Cytidylate kinase n=1 Tax=Geovibrio thiophilus TaxID=139438 RepID=A0A3R5V303_9BACT|nr:(d)CMP kinase [Geovibrio thiophilus]QAR34310.1 (d)CMP kinase [Geovibrio thiophilus]
MSFQVAVDGPAGSGKSSVSKLIAKKYGFTYLDTGAMYRACAHIKTAFADDDASFIKILENTDMRFEPAPMGQRMFINIDGNETEITDIIRTPEITAMVGEVSAMRDVRRLMTAKQKDLAKRSEVIMEGRDIGTVVLPDADVKFFFTASPTERARRRQAEWQAKGLEVPLEQLENDILKRDEMDSGRKEAPLKKAEDAVELDTTGLTIDEVISIMSAEIDRKRRT